MLSISSSRIVGTTPIACPTWMITYSSISGTTMKRMISSGTRDKATQAGLRARPPILRAMPTEEQVYEALEEVIDPELGLDFVSLGLVYDVNVDGEGEVDITFTLTTPACPIGPQVSEQMREFVGDLDGVQRVNPKMIFDPPWSPEMMSEDAKFALGY